ncbi:hypothetical protein HMPREF0765_0034 [Sphingobacterium spiritivorum ATCC 33300]|uniref:Uncharacterized protein n=1 Tax=Sphingobacterium spiritivorum ATCC 33300 TaxID=525372 RepID=C2FRS8_SPHSI|nr:hypothetical protein HMPREF0765_0034 [Sphingobacterium spiritivorum ATCC 33300]
MEQNAVINNSKASKPLLNKGFMQLQKFSKNRQTNWQTLADKLSHP